MTDGAAPLPFYPSDIPPDSHHPAFDFTIVAYVQAPTLIHRVNDPPADFHQRQINDEEYKRSVAPTVWNRFTILGFQATTGKDFDDMWRNRYSDPLRFHRLVWYNYLYYADRGFDINAKLHFWATNVAQPFLIEHSPESLDMEKHADRTLWKQVGKNNRSPRRSLSPPPADPSLASLVQRPEPERGTRFKLPTTETVEADNGHVPELHPDQTTPKLPISTPRKENDNANMSSSISDAKQSAFTMSNEVTTNDGTHRITFKWKMSKSVYTQLTQNRTHLLSEIHSILGVIFSEPDGNFYQWENEALSQARNIHELSVSEVREFLAPAITTIPSLNMIIFNARFGFAESPIAWKNTEIVRTAMQLNNIQVSFSNAKSTDGNLTVAGYILLKHPSMTHRHKYMQYLRQHLPEGTPYFDIWYHRTTPAHKSTHRTSRNPLWRKTSDLTLPSVIYNPHREDHCGFSPALHVCPDDSRANQKPFRDARKIHKISSSRSIVAHGYSY